MRARFLHAADIHLGYEQYNLTARANDFARAYMAMVEYAVGEAVDFVLVAGDLFHRASADAWMLKQATQGLTTLRDAGIPVIAIEGNHDVQHARKQLSWLEYLCDQELLCLLNVRVAENGLKQLVPWDPETRRGSWIDVAEVRVYGMKYYGAATARVVEEVADQVEPRAFTIMMLHAGMQGQVPNLHGGLTLSQLAPLRPAVDYLALGHVHQRLKDLDGWINNPGSTETNSMEELDWPHGFFRVEVDTDDPVKHTVHTVETPTLRPFRRISVNAEPAVTVEELVALVEERVAARRSIPEKAVIELHLGGVVPFKRRDVPVEQLTAPIKLAFDPLVVRVRNNLVPPGLVTVRHGERLKRADLEREIVERLVYQDGAYRDRAAAWTRLILDVKNMAVDKDLVDSIADHVERGLDRLDQEQDGAAPEMLEEEPAEAMGGEPPCMAHLFEDY